MAVVNTFDTKLKPVSGKVSIPRVTESKIPHQVGSGTKAPADFIQKPLKK